jgi:DNA polymerase-1
MTTQLFCRGLCFIYLIALNQVKTLLIDADFFFYRAAAAVEEEHDYSEELSVIVGNFAEAKKIVNSELDKLKERFQTNKLILTFTDRENFRKTIDPSYKGNRTKRKPCGYLRLKNWGLTNFKSVIKPGLEADDVCGILATNGMLKDFVLISPDKDMEQIPCHLFNLKTEFSQSPEEARRRLFEQCLTGDQTDGYSGCPGVGPKKAEAILRSVKDGNYWPVVVKTYLQAQQTEEDALRNLRLARILQASDWDSAKQQPIHYIP